MSPADVCRSRMFFFGLPTQGKKATSQQGPGIERERTERPSIPPNKPEVSAGRCSRAPLMGGRRVSFLASVPKRVMPRSRKASSEAAVEQQPKEPASNPAAVAWVGGPLPKGIGPRQTLMLMFDHPASSRLARFYAVLLILAVGVFCCVLFYFSYVAYSVPPLDDFSSISTNLNLCMQCMILYCY